MQILSHFDLICCQPATFFIFWMNLDFVKIMILLKCVYIWNVRSCSNIENTYTFKPLYCSLGITVSEP